VEILLYDKYITQSLKLFFIFSPCLFIIFLYILYSISYISYPIYSILFYSILFYSILFLYIMLNISFKIIFSMPTAFLKVKIFFLIYCSLQVKLLFSCIPIPTRQWFRYEVPASVTRRNVNIKIVSIKISKNY